MKKKIKLNLEQVVVKSFITEIEKDERKELKGGAQSLDPGMCTHLSCGIVACTRDILNCF